MKSQLTAAILGIAIASAAQADSHNPALKSGKPVDTTVAAQGRNSFTQAQAKGRLEKAGYTGVSKLVKNKNGVWQGSATKDGQNVLIGVDYKGNVIIR